MRKLKETFRQLFLRPEPYDPRHRGEPEIDEIDETDMWAANLYEAPRHRQAS